MAKEFNQGDQVYSIHGEAGRYIARASAGHLVEPTYDDHDDEGPVFDEPRVWREVFKTPPTQRLQGQVAELEKELTTARQALDKVQAERRAFDQEERARLARIKQHEQLAQLDDFLAGRITHMVLDNSSSGLAIQTAEEALPYKSEYDNRWDKTKKLRLLTLYGDSAGNLAWNLSRYTDGSDHSETRVYPCTSYEQALYKVRSILRERLADKLDLTSPWRYATDVKQAGEFGEVPVPPALTEALDTYRRRNLEERLAKVRKELADAEAAARAAGVEVNAATAS